MNLEHPWHEKTQGEVAKQGIGNEELQGIYEELLLMDYNKREALVENLFRQAKELDPKSYAAEIRDMVALLVNLDNSGVKGNPHNLQAGTLLNKLKDANSK